jgi:NAD(P)H-hydrate repair Nnr-like enzyme with NAD(P)H-hydrate epimerase domain
MIPFSEVRVLDINSEFLGVTPEFLMEEAGKGVAQLVRELTPEGSRIGMVCVPVTTVETASWRRGT